MTKSDDLMQDSPRFGLFTGCTVWKQLRAMQIHLNAKWKSTVFVYIDAHIHIYVCFWPVPGIQLNRWVWTWKTTEPFPVHGALGWGMCNCHSVCRLSHLCILCVSDGENSLDLRRTCVAFNLRETKRKPRRFTVDPQILVSRLDSVLLPMWWAH